MMRQAQGVPRKETSCEFAKPWPYAQNWLPEWLPLCEPRREEVAHNPAINWHQVRLDEHGPQSIGEDLEEHEDGLAKAKHTKHAQI